MAASADKLTNIKMFQLGFVPQNSPETPFHPFVYKRLGRTFFIPSDNSREYYLKIWPSLTVISNSNEFLLLVVRQVQNAPSSIKKERLRCIFFISLYNRERYGFSFESADMEIIASGNTEFDISETKLGTERIFILCDDKYETVIQQCWRERGCSSSNNQLIISCVFQLLSQEQNEGSYTIISEQGNVPIPKSSLLSDFDKLIDGEDHFGDVVIIVDGRELVAYKGILAARSPVFAAMFRSEMKESKENQVVIDDIEYEVVKEMLRYIHTDQAPNLSKMATKLFVAADKYQLLRLKTMCELHACSNLATETVALDLLSAVLHDGKKLKTSAIEYIKRNKQAVAETKHWKDVMTNHPALLGQIILDFI